VPEILLVARHDPGGAHVPGGLVTDCILKQSPGDRGCVEQLQPPAEFGVGQWVA
jgi:hypothetical protein